MPDGWEEQKRQAQSPFNNEPALSDAIRQAAQNARDDIEKLVKRQFLQGQDEINIAREETEGIIERLRPGYVDHFNVSEEERMKMRQRDAAWREEIWEDPYRMHRYRIGDHWYKVHHSDLERPRIRNILRSNGLTEEDIERQNRLRDIEPDIEPEP
jgi:hypothetical protein